MLLHLTICRPKRRKSRNKVRLTSYLIKNNHRIYWLHTINLYFHFHFLPETPVFCTLTSSSHPETKRPSISWLQPSPGLWRSASAWDRSPESGPWRTHGLPGRGSCQWLHGVTPGAAVPLGLGQVPALCVFLFTHVPGGLSEAPFMKPSTES